MHTSLRSFLASAMLLSTAAFAADGDLDTTYNTPNGFNSVSFGASDNVYGGFLQPDGKFLVIGGARPVTNQEMSVARFNADGTLDTATFGSGTGKFSIDINVATTTDRGTCGGLQSDGKIIIGGYSRTGSGNDDYAIIRLNTNGTLDTSFGTSGIAKVDFNGGTDRANALVVLADNSIVIAGMSSDFNLSLDIDYSLAKLTSNGALDTSFDTDGKVTVDVGGQQDAANGLTVQSDGKIIFCGQSFAANGDNISVVGRLTATGVLDSTFGGGDGLYTATAAVPYALNDVKVQSDGMVVVCGTANVSNQLDGLVLRLTSAGTQDTGFNTTGILTLPLGTLTDAFYSLFIQTDGKIVAGGFWQNPGPNVLETVLIRVNTNGTLDSGFATGGIKKLLVGSGQNRPVSIRQAADGKILVAMESGASSAENFTAARFQNTVAVATAPEIAVTEAGIGAVADGGSFSFGTTTVGTPVTKTFTVTNSGSATLNLSALSVPAGFSIAQNFASSTVAASGGTTTFQITMTAAAAATPSGSLTFTSNDADEGSYDFTISGTVSAPAGIAQMGSSASQYSTSSTMSYTVNAGTDRLLVVALGDPNTFTNPTAVTYNGTPMLQANATNDGQYSNDAIWYLKLGTGGSITGNIVVTFAAGGNGTSQRFIGASAYSGVDQTTPVDINGPKLTGSHTGTNLGSSLNVTSQTGDVVFDLFDSYNSPSATTVTTGANQTLVNNASGAITPSGGAGHYTTSTEAGAPTVTMSWTSNATAILHLTMNINAAAGGAPAAPEIAVTESGNPVADGGSLSFGTTTVGTPVTKTFTVTNTGSAPLTLSGLLAPSGFAVSQDFASTTVAAGGGTTTFQIQMHAVSAGPQSGSVTFTSNDADESNYDFSVSGTVNAPASPDYTVTTASGTLTITDSAGNGDTLSLTAPSAGNILFTATGRTFSLNGAAATTNNSGTISLAGITSIVVNAAGGSDTVTVNGFTALRSLTINGGTGDDTVNFGGNVTFAAGANLDVDLQNDDPAPGVDSVNILASADVETSGSGSITVKASRSISIGAGGGLTSADGDLILEANQQTVPTAGTFFGVEVLGTVSSIGLGNVTISGRGGNFGNPNDGVELIDPSAVILSNSGDLTLTGVAGVGASSEGVGLDAGTVTTFSGNLSLIGDTVFIGGSANVTATGLNVAVKPLTPGRPITVGTVVAGSLTIFNGLNRITCDTVNLGDSASGAITVNQVITPTSYRTLAFGKGTTFTATGGFGATVPSATTYERMTVAGGVVITAGATFTAASSGGYIWNGTDMFTFLDNDLSDAISGTFTGPTLTNFLGSALTAAQSYTGGSGNDFEVGPAPVPEIAVSYNGNDVADGSSSVAALNGTDFGSTPVQGVTVDHVFTITNSGGTALTLGSVSAGGDFTVTQPTSPVAANGGTTTFTVSFNPSAVGVRTASITFTNSDGNESPFDFTVSGVGTGPRTFDLVGNAVSNTPFDGGETYIYSVVVGPPPPAPVAAIGGQGVITGADAPDATGADSGLDFDMLTRGGFIAENGHLAFPGELTGPGVDGTNFKGFWKHNGTLLSRLARTGDNAPETGATAAKFSDLPLIPGINDAGQVTLLAALAANPGSTPPTTIDNDTTASAP